MRITFSKTLLLATTAFSMISVPAANAYLSPLSFNEMYAHASRGNLTVLNNAILRGMNINAVNGDGDTGICVAIRRGDHIAYESFRNTGAHTRPRCLNNINAKQYKKFMADHRPYELAYRKEGSSIWWWIGGAAAVGGIALAAGGGGGGGGSDPLPVPAPEDPTFHSNKGLGYVVATSDPSEPETTPYEPVMISAEDKTTEVNRESMQLSNNAKMWVYNPDTFGYDTLLLSDLIDFDKDINSYTKYIRVGMRAYNDSVVINDTEQTISAGSGTVGLDALLNSSASNLGTIEISAPNGSIGMVASDYSEAGNTGTISGKADTARGRVTGMQTRLTSYYADFVNKAVNSGKIELSGSSDNAGGMSLWGMSSWLDRAFIDGDKSAAKLDKATLTNKGDISLTFSLQPSDEEGAVDPEAPLTLAAGNGGIVGMHADANTTATNNGNITIAVTGDAGETLSAGMQAVRGGSIVNGSGKNITVSAEGSAYGMMAISGSNGGKNFTDVKSAVDNRGSITVTTGDTAYGIYSSVKGDVKNSGKITINGAGYGIKNEAGSVENDAVITLNASSSYGILAKNIENSGEIYINKSSGYGLTATDGGSITNYGSITASGSANDGLYGQGSSSFHNEGNITIDGQGSWGLRSSNNVETYNSGRINMSGNKSYGMKIEKGTVENHGDITTADAESFGIWVNNVDSLTNSGTVTVNGADSVGIYAGGSSGATNSGTINVNGDGGKGINTTANSSFTNKGTINVNGKNGYGIYAEGTSKVTNSGDIYLNATTATKTSSALYAGGSAVIENSGNLHITASGNGYIWAAYAEGSGSIKNSGTIYVDKATDLIFSGNVTNNGTIEAAAGRMLLNEQVKFGSNARFVADEIAGTASVSADTVKQSNRTQFVLSGNFEGNTDRLNVRSESYLFDADFDGEKTTLNMKKFAEVENNASIAGFLQNNYGRNNNSDLFDELKSASSQKELTKRISQISGRDVIPTMAEQNLALMKDLHRQFDNAWFNAAPDDKLIAGFNYYDRERGGYGNFAGSDDNAVSLFGIFRNNEGKNVSYGLGWSISKFDSKYDNGGKKDEVIAEILLPFGFGNENFRFLGNMYGGYGNGEYKRYAEGGRFTGDVENYYYGVNNELRGSFDAGFGISLQPTAEFNVAGLYQSGIDDGGLKTGHNNNLSVESGFGLYAEKEFLFNDENSLRLRFGSTWYHEFNDKYQTVKARLDGMEGRFAMDRAEYEKDRGLFSLNGEYRNGGFSFYGETAFEAGRSDNWIFNTGFKYAF